MVLSFHLTRLSSGDQLHLRVANNAAAIILTTEMGILLFLCVLSMVAVACTAATGEGLHNILCYDYIMNW